jgi:hypothetical protein
MCRPWGSRYSHTAEAARPGLTDHSAPSARGRNTKGPGGISNSVTPRISLVGTRPLENARASGIGCLDAHSDVAGTVTQTHDAIVRWRRPASRGECL